MEKIFISGGITNCSDYKEHFAKVEKMLTEKGYAVLNPAIFPAGLTQEEYMRMCIPMLQICDEVYMLDNWKQSEGAKIEHSLAEQAGKTIHYEPVGNKTVHGTEVVTRYRKKPIIVEAKIYEKGMEDGYVLKTDKGRIYYNKEYSSELDYLLANMKDKLIPIIHTLEGDHEISEGDYIITGIKGERYPCKPDIFEETYEKIEEMGLL